ncbi:sugar transferase [Erysipelothrix sp. HDW6A]|uniref:sugar transferase n=1 Tax=Erysipelothrix sp. HDW6A TaxID=2714928 RepID=UPI00140C2D14|nr:sugar transferase [Erysipelothrix sp. HDW6A]QIK56975.1 sugar transferase [Erysipelothrix sp. HDW6A]
MNRIKTMELSVFLADLVALLISYLLASYTYLVLFKNDNLFFELTFYSSFSIYLISFVITEFFTLSKNKLFLSRTKTEEFFNVTKNVVLFAIAMAGMTFILGKSIYVSRGVYFLSLALYLIFGVLLRKILIHLYRTKKNDAKTKVLVITTQEQAKRGAEIERIQSGSVVDIVGYAIIDANLIGSEIGEISVVANLETLPDYVRYQAVDGVLVILSYGQLKPMEEMLLDLESMGILIHLGLDTISQFNNSRSSLNYIGDYPVMTHAEVFHSEESMIIKRIIDVVGGIVGSVITILVAIILGPIIKMESPGPILFKQKRVGKNGRFFEIYKFRSMGVDAEARKKDLMNQNEVDGHMFKMTNDPRVTKVGKFIRATSIDELPQFFNVLKGDMSLVGTRPPTIDEFREYKSHHKKRLSMKPGITGMWQVSGRSNITDFEEVVRLDADYIDNYTLLLDFKILAKTFVVVFAKIGSK